MGLRYRPVLSELLARLAKVAVLLLAFFLIWWFVSTSDPGRITEQLGKIGAKFFFIVLATFAAHLLVTAAWRICFIERPGAVGMVRLFLVRLVGESLAQVNPTSIVAGETMKAMLLHRLGVPYGRSVTALTLARLTIWLSGVTIIAFGAIVFLDRLDFSGNQVLMSTIVALIVAGAAFFIVQISRSRPLFSLSISLPRRLFPAFRRFVPIEKKLQKIDRDIAFFFHRRGRSFAVAYTLSLLHWLGGATEFYLILTFLGVEVSFFSCIAIEVGVMLFKALGSFVPGQIGVEEYANRLMLDLVGIPGGELWVSVSILRRTRQLFWIGMGTLVFSLSILGRRKSFIVPPESYGSPVHHP